MLMSSCPSIPPAPLPAQIREVKREIAMRHKVFGRKVTYGTMTQAEMDEKVHLMTSVLHTLETLEAERAPSLF
ncbi:MAG: hypothetical protein Rubg2KO_15310 [Rubricoccaceae bacterium]